EGAGQRSASGGAARGRARRQLLQVIGGRGGRDGIAQPSPGSIPDLHARPGDEDPGSLHQVMLALLLVILMGQDAPRVLLDQSPRAVEYQLGRLNNDQLAKVERLDTDDKYRPVYAAILARKGMARPLRAEALAALVKMG